MISKLLLIIHVLPGCIGLHRPPYYMEGQYCTYFVKNLTKNLTILCRIAYPDLTVKPIVFPDISLVSYSNTSWSSNYATRLKHLQVFINVLTNLCASTGSAFLTHSILSVENLNKIHACLFMYQAFVERKRRQTEKLQP